MKLFNPNGNDSDKKLLGSDITNILDLSNVKYPFFLSLVDEKIFPNNWLPQEGSSLTEDRRQYYEELTDNEREVFNNILSFLVFLDSIQTNNLPAISEYVTLPEIKYFLSRQTWDEALHSRSYGYILSNMLDRDEMNKIIYRWRDNPILLKRVSSIASIYEEAFDKQNDINNERYFLLDLIANYLLEGLYFYNGFQFFHNLASRNLMIGTDIQIRYIQRDENLHCVGFRNIINIFKDEGFNFDKELVYSMFKQAVDIELEFSFNIIGNNILGMNKQSIEDYTYYLANKRLKEIGLEPIFPNRKNPYKHLEQIASIDDETSNRSNQFEVRSITYKDPSVLDGWDLI